MDALINAVRLDFKTFNELDKRFRPTLSDFFVSPLKDIFESIREVQCNRRLYSIIPLFAISSVVHFTGIALAQGPSKTQLTVIPGRLFAIGAFWMLAICDQVFKRKIEQLEQLSHENPEKKEGMVLVLNPVSDWNGAFRPKIADLANYQKLSKKFQIKTVTVAKSSEVLETINKCVDDGANIKMLVIGGHGTIQDMGFSDFTANDELRHEIFGRYTNQLENSDEERSLTGFESNLEKTLNRLHPEAIIILNSCSNGKPNNSIYQGPNFYERTKNIAYRVAALANKRAVIASMASFNNYYLNENPASKLLGFDFHIANIRTKENLATVIQETESNNLRDVRSTIDVARAYNQIEEAILELKMKARLSLTDPINLRIQVSKKLQPYVDFTLRGLLGNKVGVQNVQYVKDLSGDSFQILDEPVKFEIVNRNPAVTQGWIWNLERLFA